jgi:large subunit ribosomal protein L33
MVNAVNINSALRLGPSKSVGSPSRESPSFCPQKKNSPGKHREGRTLLRSNPFLSPRNARDIYIYSYSYTRKQKMAKGATKAGAVLVRLVSTLDTGFFYVKRKNPKKIPHKLEFRKYDAKARKHCLFVESKQK